MASRLLQWSRKLKSELHVVFLASKHPDTPLPLKLLIAFIVAYALSPIDLIPDFIPLLGYLDDLIIIPIGLSLAVRLIPPEVLSACRTQAASSQSATKSLFGAIIVIGIWILAASVAIHQIFRL